MAKRTHFIQADIETFFNNPEWEKALKSKVDYKQTTLFKEDRWRTFDCTFLSCLISYSILDSKEKFDEIFNILDSKNYVYSDKDLVLPFTLGAHISSENVENLIHLFKLYENRGIKLQDNKEAIHNSFSGLEHYKFDKYKLENGLVSDKELMRINFNHLHVINNFNRYEDLEVFKYVDKSEQKREKQKYIESIDFLKEIIASPSTSKKVLKTMLEDIPTNNVLFENFIQKNKLEISIFNEGYYFRALKLKPREVFSSAYVELIELIEKRLNINYLDNTGRTPQEVFEEVKAKSDHPFNSVVSLHFNDGTSVPINKQRKFK